MKTWILAFGFAFGCALAACVPKNEAQDSRTTWLSKCVQDEDCNSGFSCVCGVCTDECDDASTCQPEAGAVCQQSARVVRACTRAPICTQRCTRSSECPSDFECFSGSCRLTDGVAPAQTAPAAVAGPEPIFDDASTPDAASIECGFDAAPRLPLLPQAVACDATCPEDFSACTAPSGEPSVDRFFLAAVAAGQRADALRAAAEYWVTHAVKSWTGEEPSPDMARAALESFFAEGVPGTLTGPLRFHSEGPDCGVDVESFVQMAAGCDGPLDPPPARARCEGVCRDDASTLTACTDDGTLACVGSKVQCEGSCMGACILAAEAKCEGICEGTCEVSAEAECEGTCTFRGEGADERCICDVAPGATCNGSCLGACVLTAGTCEGQCAGTCSFGPVSGPCEETAECEGTTECAGSCNGELSVLTLAECEASTALLGATLAQCNPRRVQTNAEPEPGYDRAALQRSVDCFGLAYGRALDIQALSEKAWSAAEALRRAVEVIEARLGVGTPTARSECALGLLPAAEQHLDAAVTTLREAADFVPAY